MAEEAGLPLVMGDSLLMGVLVVMGVSMGASVGPRVVTGNDGEVLAPLPHAAAKPSVSTAPMSMNTFFTDKVLQETERQKGGRLERPRRTECRTLLGDDAFCD